MGRLKTNSGASSTSRRQRRRHSLFVAARLLALLAIAWVASEHRAHAFYRQIFDCGDPLNDPVCYLNFYSGVYPYTFGRSEGQPARGPNPLGPPYSGSTDVDKLYDVVPVVHQYYLDKFGRNGPNGFGGIGDGITVPLDYYRIFANGNGSTTGAILCAGAEGIGNAVTTKTSCLFCVGSTNLDIVAHEMNHRVSGSLSRNPDGSWNKLGTSGESGALNESLADFFSEAFERYVTGTHDWLIGAGEGTVAFRNMADPGNFTYGGPPVPYPDRYLSPNFYTGTGDGGGIHYNSTVLSKAAYLAVEGSSFNGFDIAGLGFDKVEQVWYRAQTTYFQPTETFNDAYDDIIQAATDLYSASDVGEVTKALRAVEMNMSRSFAGDFNGDGFVDASDYIIWRHGLGSLYSQGVYDIWRANFGGAPSGSAAQLSLSVPEPAAWLLAVAAGCGVALVSGRKGRA